MNKVSKFFLKILKDHMLFNALAITLIWGFSIKCYASLSLKYLEEIEYESLNLSNKKIGPKEALVLGRNKKIKTLNLSHNNIGPEGAIALAGNTSLTSLDLSFCQIGYDGAIALSKNRTLTSLNLTGNNIGELAAKEIFRLPERNRKLLELYVTWPKCIDENFVNNQLKFNRELAEKRRQSETQEKNKPQYLSPNFKLGTSLFNQTPNNLVQLPMSLNRPSLYSDLNETPLEETPMKSYSTSITSNNSNLISQASFKELTEAKEQIKQLNAEKAQFQAKEEEFKKTQLIMKQLEIDKEKFQKNFVISYNALSQYRAYSELLEEQQKSQMQSYLQIFNLLQEMSTQDLPLVQMALGMSHLHALIPEAQPSLSLSFFAKALSLGEKRAFNFIISEADKGNIEAQFLVAQAYEQGQGIDKDLKKALKWYRKASDQQHLQAKDRVAALEYLDLENAAEHGDRQAQFKLFQAYFLGTFFPRDTTKAMTWLEKAADQDYAPALIALGVNYENGLKGVIDVNLSKAIALYQRALPHDSVEALAGLKRLAHTKNAEAQFALAQAYEQGQGVKRDTQQALELYSAAAQQHYACAFFALGRMSEEGAILPRTPTAKDILEGYHKAITFYTQAQQKGVIEASEAISRIQQTLRSLEAIKEPEIKRNLLLKKLQQTLSSPLSPDLLYSAAHATTVIRLAFPEEHQEALMQALQGIAYFPKGSHQARAIMSVLLNLIEGDEFHTEDKDAFRISELGRICQGIYSIQNPSELKSPSEIPSKVRVAPHSIRDVRIEVFNCLFKTPPVACDWNAFDQTVENLLKQYDEGISSGKITPSMLYDDEFDQQGDRTTLKALLKGGNQGRPSERFAHRLLKIESLLMHKLDESSRYTQLASWAIAGIHCSTRAEKETYDFYSRHMTDTQSMEQEEASLEMRLALILADLRKSLLSELVPQDESERIHQIAHLEKKAAQPLALVGDGQDFQDHFQIVIKSQYKAMTPEFLTTKVLQKYTPQKMAETLVKEVNKREGSRLPFSVLNKAFQQRQALQKLEEFYDEDVTSFTTEGAMALLYSTGYLERP